jgi:hypothetical protein
MSGAGLVAGGGRFGTGAVAKRYPDPASDPGTSSGEKLGMDDSALLETGLGV